MHYIADLVGPCSVTTAQQESTPNFSEKRLTWDKRDITNLLKLIEKKPEMSS